MDVFCETHRGWGVEDPMTNEMSFQQNADRRVACSLT